MDIVEIGINTTTLNADVSALEEALGKAMSESSNMFEEIDAMSGMWEGEAHAAFQAQVDIDRENMQNLFKTVTNLLECMRFAQKEYDSCTSQVDSIIGAIRI